jgi:uncharacterized membrane protein YebE (DUF533 family)
MSFGNILGQLLEQGISGQSQTQARIGNSAQSIAQGGQGFEQILGSLQSMLGGGGAGAGAQPASTGVGGSGQGSPLGGLADAAKSFLGQPQVAGMSGAQLGGLGAIAGALLGGGRGAVRGAAGGGAMALLGTLALAALQNSRAGGGAATGVQAAPGAQLGAGAAPTHDDLAAVASEKGERLALRAMIAAAKADGQIDDAEMERILDRLDADDVTDAERRFVLDEIRKPLDVADLANDVRHPAQAAEVYAASLLAIDIDSEAERAYLRTLATQLRLDPGVVSFLHQTTGAPTA